MTKTWKTTLALLSIGLLAVAAVAVPAAAKESGDQSADRREAAQQKMQERREAAAEKAEARGNHTKERCLAAAGNASVNESVEKRCMQHGEFAEKAFKARRAAHALLGAINATERQWARLNATEERLEAKLAAGNFSDNETAQSIEKRLERIDAKQEKLEERLAQLKERLGKLHAKWDAVREHVAEKRGRHHDDDAEDDDSESSSASESASESVSESSSSAPA